ncbi:hypothetical protein L9F63_020365, partial [Diploptera punctata]
IDPNYHPVSQIRGGALLEFHAKQIEDQERLRGVRKEKKLISDVFSDECKDSNCSTSTEKVQEMSCNSSAKLEIGTNKRFGSKDDTAEESEKLLFNMSGASPDKSFRIDDIFQHIFLDVNEVGTVAAAVSVTTVDKIANFRNFVINRPFIFFIRHEVTGTPLFWGAVVDPTNGNA